MTINRPLRVILCHSSNDKLAAETDELDQKQLSPRRDDDIDFAE
jgi:hypothetical protein